MFLYFQVLRGFTRVEKFGLAKGDGGEGEVAADEDHVGDAQGGQQVVEYVVHFPSVSEIFRIYIIMYMGNNFPSLTFLFLEMMLETSFSKLLPIYYYIHIYYYYCIINYFISYAQGGQQVVEYILHLSGRKKTCFLCSLFFFQRYLNRFISFGVGR